ncbi:MAG: S41 family peptidase [Dongiaceae bacterium]
MSTARRKILALCGAIILSGLLTACGTSGDGGLVAGRDEPERMFQSGYEKIEVIYIDHVDYGDLSITGLRQLASLDPTIGVDRQPGKFQLTINGAPVRTFDEPPENDPDEWGRLVADIVEAAHDAAPELAKKSYEEVYQVTFTGIVSKLDGFSRYSSAAEAQRNRESREGFGGIGVRIAVEETSVRIISVMHYTPAERVGLKAEDIITHVNDKPVAGLDQETVVDMLRGPDSSKVLLTVVRDKGKPFNVTVTRAHIVPETVTYERNGDIAHIRVYGFNLDTAESLRKELVNARKEIGKSFKGYILDLRGNPGGLLDQSVAVSDLLIEKGRIVATHGRHPDSHQYFDATPGDVTGGMPVVVLINGDSASASEIVAAALQDSGRAVVVGSNSYGKGTVQNVFRMPNDGELTLTWARFYSPSGYTLHHLGVLPSVCTNEADETAAELIDALRKSQIKPIEIAARVTVDPNDKPALDKLRTTCPVRQGEQEIDMQVAIGLLDEPALYNRALHLADLPSGFVNPDTGAVVSEAQP